MELVYIWNNTSVIVDEVLSHRLGLVPLNVDPALMQFKASTLLHFSLHSLKIFIALCMLGHDDTATDHNTIVFDLDITCTRNPAAPKGSENPDELYFNHEVLSGHLQWKPAGDQPTVFEGLPPPGPMNPNIVLAKLRPGQSIRMELHAIKGVGKDHAKFSPVGANHPSLLSHFLFN